MKKHLLLLTALLVGLTACMREDLAEISVEPATLVFKIGETEQTVTVKSNGDWSIYDMYSSSYEYWCEPSTYYGNGNTEITFIVEPNPDTEERSIRCTFACRDKRAELIITQEAKVYSISTDAKDLFFEATGGDKEITVTSSDDWTLDIKDGWCKPSVKSGKNGDKVTFNVESYYEIEERSTTAIFTCGDKNLELDIFQRAREYSISLDKTKSEFDATGGNSEVTVSSSDEWKLSEYPDWCSPSAISGKNGDKVTLCFNYNKTSAERTATITFTCGDKTAKFHAIQSFDNSSIIEFTDPYFLDALIARGIDKNYDHQISELEASCVTELNINDSNIRNLKEIKYFTALETLHCSNTPLTSLDVSNNTSLMFLDCSQNAFTTLDLSKNTALTELDCSYNKLKTLTISNTSLRKINCDRCYSMVILDVSGCTALTNLSCNYTYSLNTINVNGCTSLTSLLCHDNELTSLDVSGCTALKYLHCGDNELTSLDVSKNTALTELDCYNNQLTALDLSKNTALIELDCSNNKFETITSTSLQKIKYEHCLTTLLDVSGCTALTNLRCSESRILTTINVNGCINLFSMDCYNCDKLASLDVSKCKKLKFLSVCASETVWGQVQYEDNWILKDLILFKYHTINLSVIKSYCPNLTITYVE